MPTSTCSILSFTSSLVAELTTFSTLWYPTAPNTNVSPRCTRTKNSMSWPMNSPALLRRLTTMDEGIQRPPSPDTDPDTTQVVSDDAWPQPALAHASPPTTTAMNLRRMSTKYAPAGLSSPLLSRIFRT